MRNDPKITKKDKGPLSGEAGQPEDRDEWGQRNRSAGKVVPKGEPSTDLPEGGERRASLQKELPEILVR